MAIDDGVARTGHLVPSLPSHEPQAEPSPSSLPLLTPALGGGAPLGQANPRPTPGQLSGAGGTSATGKGGSVTTPGQPKTKPQVSPGRDIGKLAAGIATPKRKVQARTQEELHHLMGLSMARDAYDEALKRPRKEREAAKENAILSAVCRDPKSLAPHIRKELLEKLKAVPGLSPQRLQRAIARGVAQQKPASPPTTPTAHQRPVTVTVDSFVDAFVDHVRDGEDLTSQPHMKMCVELLKQKLATNTDPNKIDEIIWDHLKVVSGANLDKYSDKEKAYKLNQIKDALGIDDSKPASKDLSKLQYDAIEAGRAHALDKAADGQKTPSLREYLARVRRGEKDIPVTPEWAKVQGEVDKLVAAAADPSADLDTLISQALTRLGETGVGEDEFLQIRALVQAKDIEPQSKTELDAIERDRLSIPENLPIDDVLRHANQGLSPSALQQRDIDTLRGMLAEKGSKKPEEVVERFLILSNSFPADVSEKDELIADVLKQLKTYEKAKGIEGRPPAAASFTAPAKIPDGVEIAFGRRPPAEDAPFLSFLRSSGQRWLSNDQARAVDILATELARAGEGEDAQKEAIKDFLMRFQNVTGIPQLDDPLIDKDAAIEEIRQRMLSRPLPNANILQLLEHVQAGGKVTREQAQTIQGFLQGYKDAAPTEKDNYIKKYLKDHLQESLDSEDVFLQIKLIALRSDTLAINIEEPPPPNPARTINNFKAALAHELDSSNPAPRAAVEQFRLDTLFDKLAKKPSFDGNELRKIIEQHLMLVGLTATNADIDFLNGLLSPYIKLTLLEFAQFAVSNAILDFPGMKKKNEEVEAGLKKFHQALARAPEPLPEDQEIYAAKRLIEAFPELSGMDPAVVARDILPAIGKLEEMIEGRDKLRFDKNKSSIEGVLKCVRANVPVLPGPKWAQKKAVFDQLVNDYKAAPDNIDALITAALKDETFSTPEDGPAFVQLLKDYLPSVILTTGQVAELRDELLKRPADPVAVIRDYLTANSNFPADPSEQIRVRNVVIEQMKASKLPDGAHFMFVLRHWHSEGTLTEKQDADITALRDELRMSLDADETIKAFLAKKGIGANPGWIQEIRSIFQIPEPTPPPTAAGLSPPVLTVPTLSAAPYYPIALPVLLPNQKQALSAQLTSVAADKRGEAIISYLQTNSLLGGGVISDDDQRKIVAAIEEQLKPQAATVVATVKAAGATDLTYDKFFAAFTRAAARLPADAGDDQFKVKDLVNDLENLEDINDKGAIRKAFSKHCEKIKFKPLDKDIDSFVSLDLSDLIGEKLVFRELTPGKGEQASIDPATFLADLNATSSISRSGKNIFINNRKNNEKMIDLQKIINEKLDKKEPPAEIDQAIRKFLGISTPATAAQNRNVAEIREFYKTLHDNGESFKVVTVV